MKTLETNDWMIINSIIYKIYTMEEFDDMRSCFLEQMKMVMDFDSADFILVGQEEPLRLVRSVFYNGGIDNPKMLGILADERRIRYNGKNIVYRESDVIEPLELVKTKFYQEIYRPNNWQHAIHMVLGGQGRFCGLVTFYRNIGKDDFQYDDIFVLDMLKDHLAFRVSAYVQELNQTEEKYTVTEVTARYSLTKREHTILQGLMAGKDNQQICQELTISVNTLKKHILNIYRKLGIRNRVQLFKMVKEKE